MSSPSNASLVYGCGPLLAGLVCACAPPPAVPDGPPPLVEAALAPGYPQLDAPCSGPIAEPSHLVITSTDFHTGAVGLLDLDALELRPDLALASSDAVPFVSEGRVFVVNRFGFDYIDELDARDLALVHEWPVVGEGASANPHALVLDARGDAWVTLHGVGWLQRFVFPELSELRVAAELALDLSSFADADGVPELSAALRCGETLFVSAERVDRSSWAPTGEALLVPVGAAEQPRLYDFDPAHEGADGLPLRGAGTGPWRLDPGDPSGHTLVMLSSGLERIELAAGRSSWIVDEQVFLDAGYDRLQLSGFDLDSEGRAWVSAATPDFSSFELLLVTPGEGGAGTISVELEGLQSVTGSLEIARDIAWFADTTLGASGLRAFELSPGAVAELPGSPFALGLPPMYLAPLLLP